MLGSAFHAFPEPQHRSIGEVRAKGASLSILMPPWKAPIGRPNHAKPTIPLDPASGIACTAVVHHANVGARKGKALGLDSPARTRLPSRGREPKPRASTTYDHRVRAMAGAVYQEKISRPSARPCSLLKPRERRGREL